IAVDARDQNDQFVACIRSFVDQADVIRRLATLDVSDNQPASLPCAWHRRVASEIKNFVGDFIQSIDDTWSETRLPQESLVAAPIPKINFMIFCTKPWLVPFCGQNVRRPQVNHKFPL